MREEPWPIKGEPPLTKDYHQLSSKTFYFIKILYVLAELIILFYFVCFLFKKGLFPLTAVLHIPVSSLATQLYCLYHFLPISIEILHQAWFLKLFRFLQAAIVYSIATHTYTHYTRKISAVCTCDNISKNNFM